MRRDLPIERTIEQTRLYVVGEALDRAAERRWSLKPEHDALYQYALDTVSPAGSRSPWANTSDLHKRFSIRSRFAFNAFVGGRRTQELAQPPTCFSFAPMRSKTAGLTSAALRNQKHALRPSGMTTRHYSVDFRQGSLFAERPASGTKGWPST